MFFTTREPQRPRFHPFARVLVGIQVGMSGQAEITKPSGLRLMVARHHYTLSGVRKPGHGVLLTHLSTKQL